MRKALAIVLAIFMVISLAGCGSESGNAQTGGTQTDKETTAVNKTAETKKAEETTTEEPTTEAVEPLDLTGLWIQEKHNEDSYMAASIRDDGKIGVFFILKDDDTPWTYWVGTYEAPEDSKEEYTWVSGNTYGGNGLLASSADTKEFEYKDGKISYSVSIQGETGTVSLVRGDWDTQNIPDSAFGSVKISQADFKNIEVKDFGWLLKNEEWLYYYVVLHNPNDDIVVELPSFRITARDANGILLGTEDQTISAVYPGQDFVYGFQAFSVDEMPDKVEIEMLDPKEYNLKSASVMDEYKDLEVINAGIKSEKLLGEINNPNDYDIDSAIVVGICKNESGEVIGIESTFVDGLKAGETTPFSTSAYGLEGVASVECFANQW